MKKGTDMALALGAKKLHERRRTMYAKSKEYNSRFIDAKTGLCKKQYLEERACPVCGSKKERELFIKGGGRYVGCEKCRMVYLNPAFTDRALDMFYSGNLPTQAVLSAQEIDFGRMIYGNGLAAISKFKKTGTVIDVGCSSGLFLDMAKERGWKTIGVELNSAEAAIAQKKHEVYVESIQRLMLDKKCDVVTMWDVLEHIKDGKSTLELLADKYLTKRGLVFLQIPNVRALAVSMMQEKSKMFDGIEHVNLYDPETIRLQAERSGFDVVHLSTIISEIPIMANYLDYQDPYFGTAIHGGKVAGLIDEKTLHTHLLGYKMQVVLRRR